MSWLTEPDSDSDSADWDYPEEPRRNRGKIVALIVAGWLIVSLIVLVGLLTFGGHHSSTKAGPTTPAPTATPSPTAAALPGGWVRQAGDDQPNCAAHSYGQVAAFFAKTPCTTVHRVLATTTSSGKTVVIATNVVTFTAAADATRYQTLVASDGTGNISDLLREGVRFTGAPTRLPATAAFASRVAGTKVYVAEAAYTAGTTPSGDVGLKSLATLGVTS